jgi:ribosomal protein L37E
VCERKKNCASCGGQLTSKTRVFQTLLCQLQAQRGGRAPLLHAALKNRLPLNDNVLYVFYDFETTQDTEIAQDAAAADSATRLHVPNLVCLQPFCSECEAMADIDAECGRCGKRRHAFWEDPVADLLSHLCV